MNINHIKCCFFCKKTRMKANNISFAHKVSRRYMNVNLHKNYLFFNGKKSNKRVYICSGCLKKGRRYILR